MTIIGELSPAVDAPSVPDQARAAARAGLDFLVRHQVTDAGSADCGRFAFCYDCRHARVLTRSTNWTTGVAVEALLAGHQAFNDARYLTAATAAVGYLRSLQLLNPARPRLHGVFREVTPQSSMAHPRDALTAAWALLDYADLTGDADARERAITYADWFINVGMEKGFPYWTVRFDDQPWEPTWCGSFHSGSAFFLYRVFQATGKAAYRQAMYSVLDYYNAYHLSDDGEVTVILDRTTNAPLPEPGDRRYTNPGWEQMHVYNDDFGALANLAAWKLDGDSEYLHAAQRFLKRMLQIQRPDGGFGPAEQSIPSAGAAVLLELLAAKHLGQPLASAEQLERAAKYVLSLQITPEGPSHGAFLGFNDHYTVDGHTANLRTGAYAILSLLRYAEAVDGCYYFAGPAEG